MLHRHQVEPPARPARRTFLSFKLVQPLGLIDVESASSLRRLKMLVAELFGSAEI
jgi:hypothetical protein